MMKIIMIGAIAIILQGCTLSFTNVMTSGEATDVVDSTPRTDSTVSPNLNIPATAL